MIGSLRVLLITVILFFYISILSRIDRVMSKFKPFTALKKVFPRWELYSLIIICIVVIFILISKYNIKIRTIFHIRVNCISPL